MRARVYAYIGHCAAREHRATTRRWLQWLASKLRAFDRPKTSRDAGFRCQRRRDFLRRGIEPRRRNLRRCRWLKGRRVKIGSRQRVLLGQGRRHTEGGYRSNIGHRGTIPCRKSTWLLLGNLTNRHFRKHASRPSRLSIEPTPTLVCEGSALGRPERTREGMSYGHAPPVKATQSRGS